MGPLRKMHTGQNTHTPSRCHSDRRRSDGPHLQWLSSHHRQYRPWSAQSIGPTNNTGGPFLSNFMILNSSSEHIMNHSEFFLKGINFVFHDLYGVKSKNRRFLLFTPYKSWKTKFIPFKNMGRFITTSTVII